MADYSYRDVTLRRREYYLKTPTNWAEVSKMTRVIEQHMQQFGLDPTDDAVHVETRDNELVYWIEFPKGWDRTKRCPMCGSEDVDA